MRIPPALLVFAAVTLLLHGIWEHAHIVLYTGYEVLQGALPVWMLATLGDLLYALVIIGSMSLAKGGIEWIRSASWGEYGAAVVLGFFIALMVEYKGLYLGRWEYLPSMPIVPFFGVGLSPLLQMPLLTVLSLLITKKIVR